MRLNVRLVFVLGQCRRGRCCPFLSFSFLCAWFGVLCQFFAVFFLLGSLLDMNFRERAFEFGCLWLVGVVRCFLLVFVFYWNGFFPKIAREKFFFVRPVLFLCRSLFFWFRRRLFLCMSC